MYLQLADNDPTENYDTLRTNQGDLYIRKDLSAGGKGAKFISKATGVLAKVAPFVPLPGAGLVGKALTQVSGISGKVSTGLVGKPAIPKGTLLSKLKKPISITPTATMPMTISTATMPTEMDVTGGDQKLSFFKKYKLPILIGGGVLLLGGAYLLLKKKKR